MRRPSIVPLGAVVAIVAVLGSSLVVSAATTWGMSRSPSTISQTAPTTVHIEFWNLGGDDGTSDLGCVEIAIPVTFSVGAVKVVGQPAGTTWQASKSGVTTVRIRARNGGSRLNANSPDHVAVDIVVTALVPGLLPWDAHAHSDQQCTKDFSEHISWTFTAGPTPTPTVVPTPTATPTATPTPAPTATPKPTPTPTAKPTATPTPVPTPHPTPIPTPDPTPTPDPSGTPTASPDPSGPPDPSASPTPTGAPASPSPTPSTGTGGGATTTGGAASGGGGASDPIGPGAQIAMPGVDQSGPGAAAIAVSGLSALSFGGVEWMVPGLVLTVPGLLIVLVVLLQVVGALAWLPVARRRLGGADDTVRRSPSRVAGPR